MSSYFWKKSVDSFGTEHRRHLTCLGSNLKHNLEGHCYLFRWQSLWGRRMGQAPNHYWQLQVLEALAISWPLPVAGIQLTIWLEMRACFA